ncbi:hypothetical protein B7463_g9001, partial [Scytalidium lignicola]
MGTKANHFAQSTKLDSGTGGPKQHADPFLIPEFAGLQKVTARYQLRTQLQYTVLTLAGLFAFYNCKANHFRVAGLACLFPGAGFLAVGGLSGAIGIILTLAFLPFSLFAWFEAGGLAFVLANWIVPGIVAAIVAGDDIWEPSAPIAIILVVGSVTYTISSAQKRHAATLRLRESRNKILEKEDSEWNRRIESKPDPAEKRELTSTELRLLQHFVEISFQESNDWSNFSVVDQFQTSALRYQLYQMQWALALVQKYHMPSFQGYIKSAQERLIEKSTTKDVMGYWKWESLWGKFTLAGYQKRIGIAPNPFLKHSRQIGMLAPIPNWIYSGCNLIGMQGAVAYDSYMKTGRVSRLLNGRFYRAFEEEFMNADGGVVTLRSAIRLAGILGNVVGALTGAAAMPNLDRRLWLLSRATNVRKEKDGGYTLENLIGADNIDVGNYKAGSGFAHIVYSLCAAEFGESDLQRDLIVKLDRDLHPMEPSSSGTGALVNKGLSLVACGSLFQARVAKRGDWGNLINSPVDEHVMAAPKLDKVPFPNVMVARCHVGGLDKKGLDIVLCGPQEKVAIGFKDLKGGIKYSLVAVKEGKKEEIARGISADVDGRAEVQVDVGDRSEFELRTQRED